MFKINLPKRFLAKASVSVSGQQRKKPISVDRTQLLIQICHKLPEDYRQPFLLHRQGNSMKLISQQLNIPISEVRQNIELAKRYLKNAIKEKYPG